MTDAADELEHLNQLLATLQRRLKIIERKCATYGNLSAPTHLLIQKEDIEQEIQQRQIELQRLQRIHTDTPSSTPSCSFADHLPDDEELAPFIVGPPIPHPRAFFGRERIVNRLFAQLKRPPLQNAVIIGPRRGGKTSLLRYLRAITRIPTEQLRPEQRNDWLPEPTRYRWLMVDFQDARFARREGLLRYLLNGLGLETPQPCTLERFLDTASRGIRSPTVILLDEIGKALQEYRELDDDVWESLRSLGPQVNHRLGFVLASHVSPVQLARESGHSSPFLNIFGYTATLGPFDEQAARALIASSPLPFAEPDIEWILAQSGRWPILLQALCRERLLALEADETGDGWRAEGLRQIAPFRGLLDDRYSP